MKVKELVEKYFDGIKVGDPVPATQVEFFLDLAMVLRRLEKEGEDLRKQVDVLCGLPVKPRKEEGEG